MPTEQIILKLEVPAGTSLGEVMHRSGILQRFPEIKIETMKIGIFSRIANLDEAINAGDRVEIYRDLIADPKTTRRERAAKKAANKKF